MTFTDRILTTISSERKLMEVDPGNNRDYFFININFFMLGPP